MSPALIVTAGPIAARWRSAAISSNYGILMMSEHATTAADRRDALVWCIEGLEWFLSLSARDHVDNAGEFTYYAPLLSPWRSSPGAVKVGRELVPLPPAGELVCESLLTGPNAALGMELQKRFDDLERAVLSWREECHGIVEQWRWDNDHLGDLPDNLYAIFGEPPVAILDGESEFRRQARSLLRLLEACRSLEAFGDEEADDKGVSVRDIGIALGTEDEELAAFVKRFSDAKKTTAKPLGKCPIDGRVKLYRLSEILANFESFSPLNKSESRRIRKHLESVARPPAK